MSFIPFSACEKTGAPTCWPMGLTPKGFAATMLVFLFDITSLNMSEFCLKMWSKLTKNLTYHKFIQLSLKILQTSCKQCLLQLVVCFQLGFATSCASCFREPWGCQVLRNTFMELVEDGSPNSGVLTSKILRPRNETPLFHTKGNSLVGGLTVWHILYCPSFGTI